MCVVNDRDVSKESKVEINEFFIGEKNPVIIKIPPKMWHGYMALGKEPATILYLVTKPYNHDKPDEERKSWDAFGDIWTVKNR